MAVETFNFEIVFCAKIGLFVIMTLKRYVFPLNSIQSYFNGGISFVVFLIGEGNVRWPRRVTHAN